MQLLYIAVIIMGGFVAVLGVARARADRRHIRLGFSNPGYTWIERLLMAESCACFAICAAAGMFQLPGILSIGLHVAELFSLFVMLYVLIGRPWLK